MVCRSHPFVGDRFGVGNGHARLSHAIESHFMRISAPCVDSVTHHKHVIFPLKEVKRRLKHTNVRLHACDHDLPPSLLNEICVKRRGPATTEAHFRDELSAGPDEQRAQHAFRPPHARYVLFGRYDGYAQQNGYFG